MAATTIANLWTPDIWIRAADESARKFPALISSGAVTQSPVLDQIASGGGISANLPFFKDITDTADGIQVEGSAPSLNNLTSGLNVAPILNRVVAFGASALSSTVSGEDVVAGITKQLGMNRQKRSQAILLSILRGLFNFAGAPSASAPLSAARYEAFSETGASPAAGLLIDATKFNNAAALLGELQDQLVGGALWMHPDIRAALRNADEIAFEKASKGEFMLETYKGFPVYVSSDLKRAGGTSGSVYDTYLIAAGAVGYGAKPQSDSRDAASLQYYARPDLNEDQIYDRTRSMIHVNGTKWVGTPAGQSAANAELATNTNWNLVFQTADRCGIVQIKTNG